MWVNREIEREHSVHKIEHNGTTLTIYRKQDGHNSDCVTLKDGKKSSVEFEIVPSGRTRNTLVLEFKSISLGNGPGLPKGELAMFPAEARRKHQQLIADAESTIETLLQAHRKIHPQNKGAEIKAFVKRHLAKFQATNAETPEQLWGATLPSSPRVMTR